MDVDEDNDVSHALVRFITTNNFEIVETSEIKEFRIKKPKSKDDFDKKKMYVCKIKSDGVAMNAAIQIYALGDKDNLNTIKSSGSRLVKYKFNASDINDLNVNSNSSSDDNNEKENEIKIKEKIENVKYDMQKKLLGKRKEKLILQKLDDNKKDCNGNIDLEIKCNNLKDNYDNLMIKYNKALSELECVKVENEKLIEEVKVLNSLNRNLQVNFFMTSHPKSKAVNNSFENNEVNRIESNLNISNNSNNINSPVQNYTSVESPKITSTPKMSRKRLRIDSDDEPDIDVQNKLLDTNCTADQNITNERDIDVETKLLDTNNGAEQNIPKNEKIITDANKNVIQNNYVIKDESDRKFKDKYTNENGIKMIYLKNNISIPDENWQSLMRSKDESKFTKNIFHYFYNDQEAVKRCLKVGSHIKTPTGVNKRILVSPKKLDVIKKCLTYYIRKRNNNISSTELAEKLKPMNHYITEWINTKIKEAKKNIHKQLN